jgi:phosphate-selective porin OprO and OprP
MAKYMKFGLLAAAMLAVSSGAVASETDRLMELLIEKQILTQEEAEAIRSEAKVERKPLVGQEFGYEPTAPLPVDEGAEVFVRRLGVETADGSERFRIRGRVQLDAGFADLEDLEEVARETRWLTMA